MTAELKLSLAIHRGVSPREQIHTLGNLADDIWKEMLAVTRGAIVDGRYIGVMEILSGRKLRKKERDELEDRLKRLAREHPQLEPKVVYPD